MQKLCHQLASLESVKSQWLDHGTGCSFDFLSGLSTLRITGGATGVIDQIDEIGHILSELSQQGAEVDRIGSLGHRAYLRF
jgi:hypothetical protein